MAFFGPADPSVRHEGQTGSGWETV